MQQNVGSTDRWIRIVLGIVFAVLAVIGVGGTTGAIIFAILAIIGLFTGLIARCPLYTPFHINTKPKL